MGDWTRPPRGGYAALGSLRLFSVPNFGRMTLSTSAGAPPRGTVDGSPPRLPCNSRPGRSKKALELRLQLIARFAATRKLHKVGYPCHGHVCGRLAARRTSSASGWGGDSGGVNQSRPQPSYGFKIA